MRNTELTLYDREQIVSSFFFHFVVLTAVREFVQITS